MRSLFRHRKNNRKRAAPKVLHYEHLPVPVHLFVECRRNSRISLLKDKIHVRLPSMMSPAVRESEFRKLITWAESRICKKGMYEKKRHSKDLISDPVVRFNDVEWALEYKESPGMECFKGALDAEGGCVVVSGPFSTYTNTEINKTIRKLLMKLFVRHYKELIIYLVTTINDNTFKYSYNSVRLKYMSSRWGSCSSKSNINLSLRILMLPDRVRDYVIVHELAHLSEMNHSRRFWDLVAQHVPDHREIEKWLKLNGSRYDL